MAEEHQKSNEYAEDVEVKDRGLFSFLGKKEEEKPQEEVMTAEFEKVSVSEPIKIEEPKEEEKKHTTLAEKLHRSNSSSSSSSDEEEGEDGEKRKKKKGLKEKIKEKISGDKEEEKFEDSTDVPVEVYHKPTEHPPPAYEEQVIHHSPVAQPIRHEEAKPDHFEHHPAVEKYEEPSVPPVEPPMPEEKKGFLDKIKDKLPGHKKTEDATLSPPTTPVPAAPVAEECDPKEKKGIFDKIKEKIPGYHPKTEEEKEKAEKEKE